ncbi:hypothetical protein LCGC14_1870450 [marine sediment metagenome]|uniref:Uncharacterized protein n=1 Tax=marine sediment metagenome TaxID=412755 RepID=A0A0F9IJ69_9ZZZZ
MKISEKMEIFHVIINIINIGERNKIKLVKVKLMKIISKKMMKYYMLNGFPLEDL